jgi:hypothetical protein
LAFGLLLGNLNIPVLCILFLLAGRIPHLNKQQRIESILLGILMAWATIKPQFSAFFILYFLLAAYEKRNTTFLTGFIAGFCGLLVVSFLFIPDWIQQWLNLIRRYPSYTGGRIPITPIIDHFFPIAQPAVYIVFFILFAILIAWFLLHWWNNRISSLQLMAFGGFVTYFFHPTGVSYEQMIFLFPFCLWVLLGWQQKPWLFGSLWLLTIICSWVFVFLSLSQVWPGATYYGLYLLYILWLPTGLRRLPNSQPSGLII